MTAETITPNDDVTALSDRELLERISRQLDHLDSEVHKARQELAVQGGDIGGIRVIVDELAPLVPHIPRLLSLLNPGAAMRGKFGRVKPSE